MTLHHARWQDAPWPDRVDCIITDPPYSSRTHIGLRVRGQFDTASRRDVDYAALTPADCHEWAAAWAPRVRYWCCILTDHTLIPHWHAGLEGAGLYVFAPVPCLVWGNSVRMAGDGPASWAVYLIVARTDDARKVHTGRLNDKGKPVAGFGSLPGGYVVGHEGVRRAEHRIGGKPLALMQQIVRDYSRPGMLVADPCCGHGTTLVAARGAGREVWGCDVDADSVRHATRRLAEVQAQPILPLVGKQEPLL